MHMKISCVINLSNDYLQPESLKEVAQRNVRSFLNIKCSLDGVAQTTTQVGAAAEILIKSYKTICTE